MSTHLEALACSPQPLNPRGFNTSALLPYGLAITHVRDAMQEFLAFLGLVNNQLSARGTPRLESIMMQANFSSVVGEFMGTTIPKHCSGLVRNAYHNGHPDLLPLDLFSGNAARHADAGIEIKASRYLRGWQGHNPEDTWLMVFIYDSNRPVDPSKNIAPKPFQFLAVLGARLTKEDWLFSGRSATSRRTITASVTPSGYAKMMANWLYKVDPAGAVHEATR